MLASATVAISGCAKRPDAIAPVPAPAGAYEKQAVYATRSWAVRP